MEVAPSLTTWNRLGEERHLVLHLSVLLTYSLVYFPDCRGEDPDGVEALLLLRVHPVIRVERAFPFGHLFY